MEGFNQIIIIFESRGSRIFNLSLGPPQETRPRDYYRLGFGNQIPASMV
jgi:hypothetical protein